MEHLTNYITAPGLVDLHVHFREPGFEYKEDIKSGAAAAAAGGYAICCCMANTDPVADTPEVIEQIIKKAENVSITVLPIGAVTKGLLGKELTDFVTLKKAGAVALSDDGMPIEDDNIMYKALKLSKEHGILIISHCEEEETMVKRDVKLAEKADASIHIAHISTASAVNTIREAKARGVKVTTETCPHYFSLIGETGNRSTNRKMNPPLRTQEDVEAIILGLQDGTIDAIATDHAPHSFEEKKLPYNEAPNGIIGLETALAVTLTFLYHTGKLSIERIIELMSINPRKILSKTLGKDFIFNVGEIMFDPNEEWTVDSSTFKSKARNTPYEGMVLKGRVKG
ncbi:MAG: dihydroorotase [Oscillospiraceae bacterium]|jgi:dihydroorotase|nr:dihydroorotase [Oscillospiraceae bacterium]